ncbi:MAG TPA: hypothetical protein VHS31_06655 [Tepidisphaeraceae bacterium]|jgi:hypothetical protein|nr:hypothetical protein [Tepidisphaeraceae bacterium]
MISPILFLVVISAGTIALLIVQFLAGRVHQRKLTTLAREWRMHYAADDRFDLAARVAERLAMPGASDVSVVDLIYGMEQGRRRYIFSAHYTTGVVRWKRRAQCVASLSETAGDKWSSIAFAKAELSLVEQYRSLVEDMKT